MFFNARQTEFGGGDKNSYLYNRKAYVHQILDDKTIEVLIDLDSDDSDFFKSEKLILCGSTNDFLNVKINDNIVFYFFKYDIEGDSVKIQKIHIMK